MVGFIKRNKSGIMFLLLLLYYSGCQTTTQEKPAMIPYTKLSGLNKPLPYFIDLHNHNKNLLYYGTAHSYNPNDSMFDVIEQLFCKAKPQMVFNEGGDDWPETKNRVEAIENYGDPGFIRYLCVKNKVPVQNIEPPDSLEYAHLLKHYKVTDVVLMYFCRQWVQAKESNVKNPDVYMHNFLGELYKKGLCLNKEEMDIEKVKRNYELMFETQFSWDAIKPEDIYPIFDNTLLNEICRESTVFRDQYMVRNIEEALKKHDRIFVVMGGSHLIVQEPVLKHIVLNL